MNLSDQLLPLTRKGETTVPGWLAKQWHKEAKRLEKVEEEANKKQNEKQNEKQNAKIKGFAR